MPDSDDRSAIAKAMGWASTAISLALEMVLPGVAGVFLDRWLGSVVVFTLLGFGLGIYLGIAHAIRLGNKSGTSKHDPPSNPSSS